VTFLSVPCMVPNAVRLAPTMTMFFESFMAARTLRHLHAPADPLAWY
jgi:hypothetical protein